MSHVLDQLDLTGNVSFITGAGSGIGSIYARALSEAGAPVACVDIDTAAANEVARSLGTNAIGIEADVTSEEDLANAVEETAQEFGDIDIALANAGIGGARTSVDEYPLETCQAVIDVNLTGVFLTARETARQMIESGTSGTIISTASIYGRVGNFTGNSPAYTAAKGGVVNLT